MSGSKNPIGAGARLLGAAFLAAVVAGAEPAAAQFVRFTPPGSLASFQVRQKEVIDRGMAEARWRLGRLRLDPRFQIGDLGFVGNVFSDSTDGSEVSDLRARVEAGLAGYMGLGSKVRLAAYGSYEYAWWQEQEQLRELSPSFGTGIFGYFNRLTVTLEGVREAGERLLSSELEVPFQLEQDSARLNFELAIGGRTNLFGSVIESRSRHTGAAQERVSGLRLVDFDRDSSTASLGIKRVVESGWTVGLGVEIGEVRFETASARDSDSTSGFVQVELNREPIQLQLLLYARDVEFPTQAALDLNRELTGSGRLTWALGPRTSLSLYSGRQLAYSARDASGIVLEERVGLRLSREIRQRLRMQVFYEFGEESFKNGAAATGGRVDDYRAYGAGLTYDLGTSFELRLFFDDTRYDSNAPGSDRGTDRVGLALRLKRALTAF